MALTYTPAIHPGEVLREEFLLPLGLSPGALARRLDVPRTRIERLVKADTPVTVDTALRLGRIFETTPQFWMNMQAAYDLATHERALGDVLTAIEPIAHFNDNHAVRRTGP